MEPSHLPELREASAGAPQSTEWDPWVESHPRATLYHTWRWSEFAGRAFGFEVMRLVERDAADCLVGVMPLVEQRSAVFGRRLVSFFEAATAASNSSFVLAMAIPRSRLDQRIGCLRATHPSMVGPMRRDPRNVH